MFRYSGVSKLSRQDCIVNTAAAAAATAGIVDTGTHGGKSQHLQQGKRQSEEEVLLAVHSHPHRTTGAGD